MVWHLLYFRHDQHYHKTKPKFEHEHLAFKQEKSKFELKTKPISSFEIQILLGFSPSAFNKSCITKYHLQLFFWQIFNFYARI